MLCQRSIEELCYDVDASALDLAQSRVLLAVDKVRVGYSVGFDKAYTSMKFLLRSEEALLAKVLVTLPYVLTVSHQLLSFWLLVGSDERGQVQAWDTVQSKFLRIRQVSPWESTKPWAISHPE